MSEIPPLILIGGHGFIGSAYAAHAAAAGREVHVVGRSPVVAGPSAALARPGRRDWHWGEVADLTRATAGRSAMVVDFAYATVPSTSFGDPVGDFTGNLGAMIRHLDFIRDIGAGRYLFLSSGGTVYGEAATLPLAEDAPVGPISPYGITKLACEHYALMYRRLGVQVIIARPSNLYGPGQQARRGQGLVAAAMAAALGGRPVSLFGDGSQLRDYLYIDDMTAAIDAILARGEDGATYNVASGEGVRADALLAMIADLVAQAGRRLAIEPAEARPFDVADNVLDPRRIAAATGWRAETALADGLERAWHWMRSQ